MLPFLLMASITEIQLNPKAAKPPVAKKVPVETKLHGETLVDDYAWLRDKKNPAVREYLEAENAYVDAVMKPTEPLQEKLYKEMLGRIKQDDQTAPYKRGKFMYWSETKTGQQYPIHKRVKIVENGRQPVETILDPNELAKGHPFLGIGLMAVSDDGNYLAYSTDTTGYRQYTMRIKDLRTGEVLPDKVERVDDAEWCSDNRTLVYITEDGVSKRSDRAWLHTLGSTKDPMIYEEKDALFNLGVSRSLDRKMLFLTSGSKDNSEVRYIRAAEPQKKPEVLYPRQPDHRYYVDHREGEFYIRTNKGAKNFKLVKVSVADPKEANWKTVVAHDPKVRIEGEILFKNHGVVFEREEGLPHMRVLDFKSGRSSRIALPEPIYSAGPEVNAEYDTDQFRFRYTSFVSPPSVLEYDMKTGSRRLLKETEVLGGYDKSKYKSERLYAKAKDGTKVPIALVYRRDIKLGEAPLLLGAYGSYGSPTSFAFSSNNVTLLDRGVILATAQIRGGGDLGEQWHDEGKMLKKKNTFTDFIDCADHLVDIGYAKRERMAIRGGSAGGLLIGAVINMRPDLCKTAILLVPFVDVINTMLDEKLPLTVGEFLEWGNPKVKEHYQYMRSYSPYENIEAKQYPDILVRTSFNDSQVGYWEPAKYVARMRAVRTGDNLLLFRTNMGAGHGGASGRYDALRETAFDFAFLLSQFGVRA
jgi:oligopeptidase B